MIGLETNRMIQKLFAIATLAVATLSGSSINGTFGWVPPSGGVSFTGPVLGSATSVTISANESVNTLPATFLGSPNAFAPLLLIGSSVLITPSDLTLPVSNINGGFVPDSLPTYAQWGSGNRFDFDTLAIEWMSSAATNLSFLASGNVFDHLGVFDTALAQISGSFTTTGAGAVNASFTFSVEPAVIVGEPGFAGMVSVAVAAMILLRRRCAS